MKKIKPASTLIAATIIGIILFFSGCYEFDFVMQPTSAGKNSSFEVQVSITTDYNGNGNYYIPYFGIRLPMGWTVQDSIEFSHLEGFETGMFVYSDSLVQEMNILDPPQDGYYWWVSAGTGIFYSSWDNYLFNPVITTDSSTGTFFLDYMAGDCGDGEVGSGLNRSRSNHHFIGVDLLEHAVVTNCNDSGPGSLREALSKVDFTGTITFNVEDTDTIFLTSELEVFKNIRIQGPDEDHICISGENQTRIFYIYDSCTAEMSNLHLDKGTGGIFCLNSNLILKNLTFSSCTANAGGGLHCFDSRVYLENVIISGCSSESGGGMWFENSTPSGKYVTITECTADIGGGIYLNSSDFFLQNALLNGNTAASMGGAVYCEDSQPYLRNVTIANNQAIHGAGLFCSRRQANMNFLIHNSIIYANSPHNIYLGTQSLNDPPSITFSYSDLGSGPDGIIGIGDIYWLEGNIDEDPLFEGAGDLPFELTTDSPCIDAGNPDTTGMHLPFWDLFGNYRLWDGDFDGDTIVDMGAYEFGSIGVTTPELIPPAGGQNSKFKIKSYPNPFSEIVHIEYQIENPSPVSIQVFNTVGEKVGDLSDGVLARGQHQIIWNAGNLPAGIYFCRVLIFDETSIMKIIKY